MCVIHIYSKNRISPTGSGSGKVWVRREENQSLSWILWGRTQIEKAILLLILKGSILWLDEPADEYTVLACHRKNGAGGVVAAQWVVVARVISKSSPQPPRVMVNRGKSGVRVSVPVGRPSLFVADCGGFWRAVVWQGQSGGWGVCFCRRGGGESPIQAGLSSVGWETSQGSSPRMNSRKKALLLFSCLYVPLLWVWESRLYVLLVVCDRPVGTFSPTLALWCCASLPQYRTQTSTSWSSDIKPGSATFEPQSAD